MSKADWAYTEREWETAMAFQRGRPNQKEETLSPSQFHSELCSSAARPSHLLPHGTNSGLCVCCVCACV